MINRRDFLGSVAVLSAAGAFGSAILSSQEWGFGGHRAFYKIIYDSRFPVSVRFAGQARQSGIPLAAITGDITHLWYDDLYHHWKSGGRPIAGLIAAPSLFCLDLLARDQGLRVVHREDVAVDATMPARTALALFIIAAPGAARMSIGGAV